MACENHGAMFVGGCGRCEYDLVLQQRAFASDDELGRLRAELEDLRRTDGESLDALFVENASLRSQLATLDHVRTEDRTAWMAERAKLRALIPDDATLGQLANVCWALGMYAAQEWVAKVEAHRREARDAG